MEPNNKDVEQKEVAVPVAADNLLALRKIYDLVYKEAKDGPSQQDIEALKMADLDGKVWALLREGIHKKEGLPDKFKEYSMKLKEFKAYEALFCRPKCTLSIDDYRKFCWYRNIIENVLYFVAVKGKPSSMFDDKTVPEVIRTLDNKVTAPTLLSPRAKTIS